MSPNDMNEGPAITPPEARSATPVVESPIAAASRPDIGKRFAGFVGRHARSIRAGMAGIGLLGGVAGTVTPAFAQEAPGQPIARSADAGPETAPARVFDPEYTGPNGVLRIINPPDGTSGIRARDNDRTNLAPKEQVISAKGFKVVYVFDPDLKNDSETELIAVDPTKEDPAEEEIEFAQKFIVDPAKLADPRTLEYHYRFGGAVDKMDNRDNLTVAAHVIDAPARAIIVRQHGDQSGSYNIGINYNNPEDKELRHQFRTGDKAVEVVINNQVLPDPYLTLQP